MVIKWEWCDGPVLGEPLNLSYIPRSYIYVPEIEFFLLGNGYKVTLLDTARMFYCTCKLCMCYVFIIL